MTQTTEIKAIKKKRVIGKISEDVIFEELTKKVPKKLKEIAVLAGSLATSEDMKSRAITQKIASSSKLQAALSVARSEGLAVQNRIQERLNKKIETESLENKLNANETFTHLNKTGNLIATLTKQDVNSSSNSPTNIQINIITPKVE